MTDLRQQATARCPACGAAFACEPQADCWCKDEAFRLPMPAPGVAADGCLCPACLRKLAETRGIAKTP